MSLQLGVVVRLDRPPAVPAVPPRCQRPPAVPDRYSRARYADRRENDRFLRTGLASLSGPALSNRSLAAATRAYTTAIDDLARQVGPAA